MIEILIPTHKREKLFNRCFKSIKKQSYKDVCITVCDHNNGFENYVYNYSIDKLYFNGGSIGDNYRLLFEQVSGSYCMILEDDDFLLYPTFLKELNFFTIKYNPDWILFKALEVGLFRRDTGNIEQISSKEMIKSFEKIFGGYGEDGSFQFGMVLFKGSLVEKISRQCLYDDKENYHNDERFFKCFLENSEKGIIYDRYGYVIGKQGDNLSWK